MAEITEARIAMADGREAIYVGEAADMPKLPEWPMISISVKDFEEAQEIIATLDRSRARKRTGKEPEAEAASKPGPGPLPPKDGPDDPPCPAHADGRHNAVGEAPCLCGYRRAAVTPKDEATKRLRNLGQRAAEAVR